MYNVARDLQHVIAINILTPTKIEKNSTHIVKYVADTIFTEDLKIKLGNNSIPFDFEINEIKGNDWEHCYNNIEIVGNPLKTEIQILQDYGDREGEIPSEINRDRLFEPYFCYNIAWYNGELYLAYTETEDGEKCLSLFSLEIKHEKFDLEKIDQKRPFNFKLFNKGEDLYYWISLSNVDGTEIIESNSNYKISNLKD